MYCSRCSSTDFRLSQFRKGDFSHLLVFEYPIRCRGCQERQYAGIGYALRLLRTQRPLKRRSKRRPQI
jgi:hypothetical protein